MSVPPDLDLEILGSFQFQRQRRGEEWSRRRERRSNRGSGAAGRSASTEMETRQGHGTAMVTLVKRPAGDGRRTAEEPAGGGATAQGICCWAVGMAGGPVFFFEGWLSKEDGP